MRLADFIEENATAIVDAAEVFASEHLPENVHVDREAMRDHLPQILSVIVADLRGSQTVETELAKAEGQRDTPPGVPSAAQTHGSLRAKAGFKIELLVAEYRALRASILRLWMRGDHQSADSFDDLIRFNQAVDQAVAESVAHFAAEAHAWREIFLGVLGHDLRGPLTAILLASDILSKMTLDTPLSRHAERLILSGKRMSILLDDLLDFSRTNLGIGIRIVRGHTNLAADLGEEISMLRMAWPRKVITFEAPQSVEGTVDASRLREALANLVNNAAQHGTENGVVRVVLEEENSQVTLTVCNDGITISPESQATMFEPLRRAGGQASSGYNLGLGLFVVREVARAHGGDVKIDSHAGKTTFTLKFPTNSVVQENSLTAAEELARS